MTRALDALVTWSGGTARSDRDENELASPHPGARRRPVAAGAAGTDDSLVKTQTRAHQPRDRRAAGRGDRRHPHRARRRRAGMSPSTSPSTAGNIGWPAGRTGGTPAQARRDLESRVSELHGKIRRDQRASPVMVALTVCDELLDATRAVAHGRAGAGPPAPCVPPRSTARSTQMAVTNAAEHRRPTASRRRPTCSAAGSHDRLPNGAGPPFSSPRKGENAAALSSFRRPMP